MKGDDDILDPEDGWSLEETVPGTALQTFTPSASVSHQLTEIDQRLVMLSDGDSPRAAAFRILRHRLVNAGDPRVIMVTSPNPGEGKTACAANLALALAEFEAARVLLVEINGKNPALARLFRLKPPTCFFEQLRAHRRDPRIPWLVVDVAGSGVHVAAIAPENKGAQLVDWPVFHHALTQFRAGFDYIIIDAPPVLGSAEVNLVQDATDGVLLTAAAGRTRARDLRKAIEQLQPGRVLGVSVIDGI